MVKKIKVKQLKPGMYIHDLDCGWLDHPFFTNSLKIKNKQMIKKIIDAGLQEVYIDTSKGLDVANAPTEAEVSKEIQDKIDKITDRNRKGKNIVPVQEELIQAKKIKKAAIKTVEKIMDDVRLGKQLELEKMDHMVEGMVDSILRNEDALTNLGRIKKMDEYTYFHSVSVGILMISFGKHLGFDARLLKYVGIGGLLHDIGKMNVPVEILTKPGRLTKDEFVAIKEHVEHGRQIIEGIKGINKISVTVSAEHHERVDGSGYPRNLEGEKITQYGQMAAIVDVYDAMTSDRCYQKGAQPAGVLKKLFEWSKFHFDQELVEQFIRCVGIYPVGSLVRMESDLIGVIMSHNEESLLKPLVRVVYNVKKEKYVMPYDIDLSQPSDNGGGDQIISSEPPHKWNINPAMYL
jgi:putative nucleotidyltransferase with HDIG domain